MNRKTSRNNLLGANTRRKTASRSKLKDSDDEASQSLLRNSSNSFNGDGRGNGRAALTGGAEQEGEFDAGWKGGSSIQEDEDEQALLEEGRILASRGEVVAEEVPNLTRVETGWIDQARLIEPCIFHEGQRKSYGWRTGRPASNCTIQCSRCVTGPADTQ